MDSQQHVSPELTQEDDDSRRLRVARVLSQVLNPLPVSVLTYALAGYFATPGRVDGLLWAGLALLIQLLLPMIYYYRGLRRGMYSDPDVSDRRQRHKLYLIGSVAVLASLAILTLLDAPVGILAVVGSALMLGILFGLINTFWKISMHAGTMAVLATVAWLYWNELGLLLWLCALAVGWARVRTGNHTPMQVLAGFTLATLIVAAIHAVLR